MKNPPVPVGYFRDACGNVRTTTKTEIVDGKIFVSYHFLLEPGATTLRGEHPKLAQPPHCIYPERLSCNHGEGFNRCEFMKCLSMGNWSCTATAGKDLQ
jgi:hypothetical protein